VIMWCGSQVVLPAHVVRLGEPLRELLIDVVRASEPKGVQDVARGVLLDASEAGAVDATGENQVAVQPAGARRAGGEAHPDVQCDPGLLREHVDRTQGADDVEHAVEGGSDGRDAADEVPVQVTERGAGVDLVAGGERATTRRAGPERGPRPWIPLRVAVHGDTVAR